MFRLSTIILWSSDYRSSPEVAGSADTVGRRGQVSRSTTEQGLKGRHGLVALIVTKHEFVQVDGKLGAADTVIERPETLEGWRRLFAYAGLVRIKAVDKSEVMSGWMQESRKQLGLAGQLRLALWIMRRWRIRGVWRVLQSERVFSSERLGYWIVVGTKR